MLVGCRVVMVMSVDEMLVGEMLSVWLALAYAVMATGCEAFA
jgi:hypothetical protein